MTDEQRAEVFYLVHHVAMSIVGFEMIPWSEKSQEMREAWAKLVAGVVTDFEKATKK